MTFSTLYDKILLDTYQIIAFLKISHLKCQIFLTVIFILKFKLKKKKKHFKDIRLNLIM